MTEEKTKEPYRFPLMSDNHLRHLYGMVMRKYLEMGYGWRVPEDHEMFGLGRRMRQELVRRRGDGWLIRYHQG